MTKQKNTNNKTETKVITVTTTTIMTTITIMILIMTNNNNSNDNCNNHNNVDDDSNSKQTVSYSLTQPQPAMWYRAVIQDLDSDRPQTELGRAAYNELIVAVLQHEVRLTRACMYVGHKEQDDRQRQMNILSRDVHELRMHDAFPNMPHVACWNYVHESCHGES